MAFHDKFYKTTDPETWGTMDRKAAHIKDSNEKSALNKILKLLESKIWGNV